MPRIHLTALLALLVVAPLALCGSSPGAEASPRSGGTQDDPGDEDGKQDEKKKDEDELVRHDLMLGDLAPALTVTEWLKGDAVATLEKGKVYLIEFWATWCGPCVDAMPHLTELQEKYADKGLVVIGITRPDERGNRKYSVEEFLKSQADTIGYRIAWDESSQSNRDWMVASNWNRIPRTFVVDREGRIAYMGLPAVVDEVLDQVIEGTFDIEEAARDFAARLLQVQRKRKIEARISEAYQKADWATVALAFDDLIELGYPNYAVNKFNILMREMKDPDGAYGWALQALETCLAEDPYSLNTIAMSILVSNSYPRRDYDVARKLAERANELEEGKNSKVWNTLALTHEAQGRFEQALEAIDKAIETSPTDNQTTQYRMTRTRIQKALREQKK